MDVASMIAINNRNMITMMNALQEVNHIVLINDNGKEYEEHYRILWVMLL